MVLAWRISQKGLEWLQMQYRQMLINVLNATVFKKRKSNIQTSHSDRWPLNQETISLVKTTFPCKRKVDIGSSNRRLQGREKI